MLSRCGGERCDMPDWRNSIVKDTLVIHDANCPWDDGSPLPIAVVGGSQGNLAKMLISLDAAKDELVFTVDYPGDGTRVGSIKLKKV